MPSINRGALCATLCTLMLGVAGIGPALGADPPNQIVIHNFMFAPVSVTVKAGSTVTWTNKDEEPHTIASDSGLFRSGAIDTNEGFSFKFEQPGTYRYVCSIHPFMLGTVVVE